MSSILFGGNRVSIKRQISMRIGIDFTAALADRTGVGNYTAALTRALLREGMDEIVVCAHAYRHPEWRSKALERLAGAPRPAELRGSRLVPHHLVLEGNHRFGWPKVETLFGSLDVFHGTNFLAPPARRAATVVTVHDLAFLRYPEEVKVAHGYRRYLLPALERADRVILPSEAARRDAVELAHVPPERTAVVPEGGPETFPLLGETDFRRARRRLGIPERYFLFVGTIEPRKNLLRLLEAHRRAATCLGQLPALVVTGRRGWHSMEIERQLSRPAGRVPVIRTGFVPDELRNSLYANAVAFILPSLSEGFGLPVLEAFAGGAPVVCASAGALPEVAGDAAVYADPRDVGDLARRLVEVAADEGLREDLKRRGRARLPLFSFDRAAAETRRVYSAASR